MKRPSFQFYPGDWLVDSSLRMVSIGARGAWIDMLCLMHQGDPYGYLKVNEKVILPSNLARMIGATLQETEGYLTELESAGVFSRDESDCIFSRRMIRDEELRQVRAAGGKLGGNPALKGSPIRLDERLTSKDKQNPTPSSSSSSSSSNQKKDSFGVSSPKGDNCPHDAIICLYHEILPMLPTVREWTPARQKLLRTRWKEKPERQNLDWWRGFLEYVAKSDFLTGRTGNGKWTCSLPWLLKAENFAKVIEGHYENREAA